jgi:hypothetical protein
MREPAIVQTIAAADSCRTMRRYYKTSTLNVTVSKATRICNKVTLFDSNESPTIEFSVLQTQAFRRRARSTSRAFVQDPPMISKIIAVSVLGFCGVATVAWTSFLGWGLYELLR